jgi:hypothetical protein
MGAGFLQFKRVRRTTLDGSVEELCLSPGVNLLSGPPNTGKTQWFRFIDYLLGDPDPARDRFPPEILKNYRGVEADVCVSGEHYKIQRLFNTSGLQSKIFFDGSWMSSKDFQERLLNELCMPRVRWPRGFSPQNQKSVALSFRMLLRHMHRQQRFWSSIADKQYDFEIAACIIQFIGLATKIFSKPRDDLVRLRAEYDSIVSLQRCISDIFPDTFEASNGDLASLQASLERQVADQFNRLVDGRLDRELGSLDSISILKDLSVKYGRVSERMELIASLRQFLRKKSDNISEKQAEINLENYSDSVEMGAKKIAFGINNSLKELNTSMPGAWPHDAVIGQRLRGHDIGFYVGGMRWEKALGGTHAIHFLLGYHYSLLSLSSDIECFFPGFTMIDLPATLIDGGQFEREALAVTPFVNLVQSSSSNKMQLLIAGNSFPEIQNCNRIEMHKRYIY